MSVRPSVYINGSVVLGADESPWPCGTPSWYTPLSWMILSKQKNLHLFSSQYICVFSKMSVRPSVWRGFRAFAGECIEGLAWNLTCWCTFTIFRTDQFMAVVWWFFKFWHYFDLVKRVKFGVSGHFLENAWREWPEILHADVSWPPSELISLWPQFADFSNFGAILT